MKIQSF